MGVFIFRDYYYNHAVNVTGLRIYLLKKFEKEELRARSSSMCLCPGHKKNVYNSRCADIEAQQVVDYEDTGLFLCQECINLHHNSLESPPKSRYTLELRILSYPTCSISFFSGRISLPSSPY